MNEMKRDVGREILEGLSELKRGIQGREIDVPDVFWNEKEAGLRNYGKSESDKGM